MLSILISVLTISARVIAIAGDTGGPTVNWPCFRGPDARGIAVNVHTPVTWDAERKVHILWKTPIPGLGHSCPVVWGSRVFVTSAVNTEKKAPLKIGLYGDIGAADDNGKQKWMVYCLDKRSGKILWERVAHEGIPKIERHTKSTHSNPTLATDGKRLVASFGSEGLYCYDLAGTLLWQKNLGVLESGYYMVPSAHWGFASSPVLVDGKVIVQADVLKNAFLAVFDARDGRQTWRIPRKDVPTWSTPTVVRDGGRTQIVVNGFSHIAGYDLVTGKELWHMAGGGDIPVPTPVAANGLVYITNAHGRFAPIFAVKTSAKGDISLKADERSNEGVAWAVWRDGAYMQTPLVVGDYLYVCRDTGVLGCYNAKTGERLYQERLGTGRTGFTASGVSADGKLYYTSEDGDVYVVRAGPAFKVLATNSMGEVCMATPAISEGMMFWRTQDHLVAVGAPADERR